jgi:hypothetical protein
MQRTFRTKPRLLFTEVVLPLLLLGVPVFLLTPFTQVSPQVWLLIGLCFVVIVVVLIRQAIPLWRNRIRLDDDGLSGYVANIGSFSVLWRDIIVAAYDEALPQNTELHLATTDNRSFFISLAPFNRVEICKIIQAQAPSAALEKDAYKNLPNYQEWEAENIRLVSDPSEAMRVKGSLTVKGIAWFSILMCLSIAALVLLQQGNWYVGLTAIMLALTLPGIYLLIMLSGSIETDGQSVTHNSPFGHYRIRWDEIKRIESGRFADWLVFYGEDKRLAFMGPIMWSKACRDQMLRFIQAQVQQRDIETKQINSALPALSKNTRVY